MILIEIYTKEFTNIE